MLAKVKEFIAVHGLFSPGDRVGVAVSGGVDSVCLLHILRAMEDLRLELVVCHLDHSLRPESGRDAEFVRDLAARWGLPFAAERLPVRSFARDRGLSQEMAARELRYEALRRMAAAHGLRRVALGHHRDDQVETILLRLLRGAGLEGLAGMRPVREDGLFVRPLLGVTRTEICAYAAAHGLAWTEDATNRSLAIPRNRVRHELLPYLRSYNAGVDRSLLGLAALARETMDHLDGELARAWPGLAVDGTATGISVSGPALNELPPVLARLALRRLLAAAGGDPGRLTHAATERLRRFAKGGGGPRLSVPGGMVFIRRGDRLVLGRPAAPLCPRELAIPGETPLDGGRLLRAAWWTGNPPAWEDVGKEEVFLDGDLAVPPLSIRSRRPGDRFHPLGLGASKKVKEALMEAGIPREERDAVPVVVDGEGRIVWLAGIRLDERFKVTDATRHILHLTLESRGAAGCLVPGRML